MPMNSEVDVESEIQEIAQDAVDTDGPFVPGVMRTDIDYVSEFGDFEYYAWERYYTMGKSKGTIVSFFNAVSKLEEFIEQSDRVECSAEDIGKRDAKRFKKWLLDSVKERTAVGYINRLDNMAQFYLSDGYYPGNPFDGLTEGIDANSNRNKSSSFQTNERITVENSKLREAIRSTHGSQKILLLSMLVKTGIRISEVCNLDWNDINLDHHLADDLLPDSRTELSDWSDTIYIDCNKTESTYDADIGGNKRKVDTYIPIDRELKRLLLWHALTRERRFDDDHPVFTTHNNPKNKPSDRLGTVTAWKRVADFAENHGWHGSDQSVKKNITPHWFRAKFSSYMSKRLEAADGLDADPQDIVKGLRGDVGEDVIEDYRLRDDFFGSYIRPRQFKIGLESL